jgi:hypothetical protein
MSEESLKMEAEHATEMLHGKTVRVVWRHRSKEVVLEFTDKTRLFVDCTTEGAELSITEGQDNEGTQESRYEDEVSIRLTQAEALVLFDFCSRFTQQHTLSIEDQAEERVIWDITSILERMLLGTFQSDYSEKVAVSREKLRDKA